MTPRLLRIKIVLILSVLLLPSCRNAPNPGDASRQAETKCPALAAEGVQVSCLTIKQARYVIIRVDLNSALIKLLWKNPAGIAYGSLNDASRQTGSDLLALTNAGIYSGDHNPSGLHIEGGKTLSPLNLNDGGGNFYWKPNGVFYVTDRTGGIVESEKFNSLSERGNVREATQSGPMLVIDGEVNKDFKPESPSLYVRNGIGVKSPNEVYIVISRDEVNLYDFASVFRDNLHCRGALYLDGCVSQMYLPGDGSYVPDGRRCDKELVGMLGVLKRN